MRSKALPEMSIGTPALGDADPPAKITAAAILDASSNGVIATDAHGRVVYANRPVRRIFDFDIQKFIGSRIGDLLPDAAPLVMDCTRTGEIRIGHQIRSRDQQFVVNISPIFDGDRACGAVCSFQRLKQFELSARKLASYKALNSQLNAIIESSSDGIWVCDGRGKVIRINEASEKLNGIRAGDVVGRNMADIVAEGVFDHSVTLEVLKAGRQVSMIQNVARTGRMLLSTGTPVFGGDGGIDMVVVNERDMTQLDTIRRELEESRLVTEKFKEELAGLSLLELKNETIVAEDKAMRQVLQTAFKLAKNGASNILLLGESGTGKGLLAKFVHQNGRGDQTPFVQINCAALPDPLLEAELFGYEPGAFTGAREQGKAGLFEVAEGGTLFLDEIGDMPLFIQAKLLKYLDDQEVMRLGALSPRRIDCTVIAATNRNLEDLTRRKEFRMDLLFRLNTFTIRIPPLRDRPDDVFELSRLFLEKYNREYRVSRRISAGAMKALQNRPMPGNVRQLKGVLKRAVLMSDTEMLDDLILESLDAGAPHALSSGSRAGNLTDALMRVERDMLRQAAKVCRTTRDMALHLGISQPTVVRKLKKHGLGLSWIHK